jgi:acyl-CoA reductase-like NAD-dependent aldehyde dehydrogenase
MTLRVLNPATEETIAELEQAGAEEADEAVERAKVAFPAWRSVSPEDRGRLLRRVAELVEQNAEELAGIESQNVGKPIAGARGEVRMVARVFNFYADAVDKTIPARPTAGSFIFRWDASPSRARSSTPPSSWRAKSPRTSNAATFLVDPE